ncbi:type II toxin-antitoxin system ParD family antitoxin [Nonlabens antarcticus]|uniref:type II toxin-antitoxin system ParD family antitoxin n=1 Tax=Nonlabens antarcticus TaxID=392714 RepID=UPI00189179FD|nr:type II toxin-antitoxin system ParD family antitoxin [Nonlabens antarcticus]
MNVSFTEKQEKYIRDLVASGNYKNASEVVREAMRQHSEEQDRKLEWLCAEIQKGIDSGSSGMTIKEIFAEAKLKALSFQKLAG